MGIGTSKDAPFDRPWSLGEVAEKVALFQKEHFGCGIDVLSTKFLNGDRQAAKNVVRRFGTKHTVNMLCFLAALIFVADGPWDEKVQILFSLFALDDSKMLTRPELGVLVLSSLRAIVGLVGGRTPTNDDARKITDRAFNDPFTLDDLQTFLQTELFRSPQHALWTFGLLDEAPLPPPITVYSADKSSPDIPPSSPEADDAEDRPYVVIDKYLEPCQSSPHIVDDAGPGPHHRMVEAEAPSPGSFIDSSSPRAVHWSCAPAPSLSQLLELRLESPQELWCMRSAASYSTATVLSFDEIEEAPVPETLRASYPPLAVELEEAQPPATCL